MLHQAALAHGIKLLVVERNLPGELGSAAYLQQLAQQISDRAAGQPIRLLGFSIGACLALRVAALLGEQVAEVYLLSAAAPLEIPSNSVGMGAGRYTFLLGAALPKAVPGFCLVSGAAGESQPAPAAEVAVQRRRRQRRRITASSRHPGLAGRYSARVFQTWH